MNKMLCRSVPGTALLLLRIRLRAQLSSQHRFKWFLKPHARIQDGQTDTQGLKDNQVTRWGSGGQLRSREVVGIVIRVRALLKRAQSIRIHNYQQSVPLTR